MPGVGPVVATTFAATLDDSSRFLGAKHVRSYLGLVPRECSSIERQPRGRISKAGSVRARSLLVKAALALLRWNTEKTNSTTRVDDKNCTTQREGDGDSRVGEKVGRYHVRGPA